MQTSLIAYVKIRVFIHATEDSNKVIQAVKNLFPKQLAEEIKFKKTNLTGHHGNPIILLETRLKEKELIKTLMNKLASGLNLLDKKFLAMNFEQHAKKGSFYLRLDKQSAFKGEVKLSSADPIHLRVGFKTGKVIEMMKTFKELGILP